ncbi:MAG: peptidoglycan DD-metalloendopeptidase family protein [Epsilonproteobacteria bacterium]|nr:peptidoglycan DD-metalloendopeptidase family protein [Campylobacterota bacterium]
MTRIILLLFLIATSIFGNIVTKEKWKHGQKFTNYLQINNVSLDLLKSLDELEKQVIGEIQAGQVFYEVRDDSGNLVKAYIPISSTLQIKIAKNKTDEFGFSIIPINFKEDIYIGNITVKNSIWNDIANETHNSNLTKKLQKALKGFSAGIAKGDNIAFLYSQKSLGGFLSGSPEIRIVKITKKGKEIFVYIDEEGNGHNEPFESVSYVVDKPIIGRQTTKKVEIGSDIKAEKFAYPVRNPRITSPFSYGRYHPVLHYVRPHFGTDFGVKRGTPVMAIGDGVVMFAGYKGGYGNVVKIQHGGGYISLYAHLDGFRANVGDRVSRGDVIAYSGNTGTSSGPHLHLGIYLNNSPINPMSVIGKESSPVDFILDRVADVVSTKTYETKKIPIVNAIKYREMLNLRINSGAQTYDWGSDNDKKAKLSEDDFE